MQPIYEPTFSLEYEDDYDNEVSELSKQIGFGE